MLESKFSIHFHFQQVPIIVNILALHYSNLANHAQQTADCLQV